MQEKTYKDKLKEQQEGLRKKLEKVEAAKTFQTDPAGRIIYDWLQEQVNIIFKDMTSDKPLEREEYIFAHAAITTYRNLLKTIAVTAADETRVNKELTDVSEQIKRQP